VIGVAPGPTTDSPCRPAGPAHDSVVGRGPTAVHDRAANPAAARRQSGGTRREIAAGMSRLAKPTPRFVLAALTTLAADLAPAAASPAERDHRPGATPAASLSSRPRRHRRRPGPRIMMPLKVDIGMQGASTTMGYLPGLEVRAGIHWASLSPRPTNTDVGIGVFGAALFGPEDAADPGGHDNVVYGGAYLEVGQTLAHGDWWRTWASGRGEYLGSSTFGHEQAGFGVAGRLSAELYASGVGIEPRGVFLGTYAMGVYVEAAGRGLGEDVSALQVSAGLTFRTPLVFGR